MTAQIWAAENGKLDYYENVTRDAYGLIVDPSNATIFWTTTNGSVWSCNHNGDHVRQLYHYGGSPRGLDVGPKHGDLYWADPTLGHIVRGDLGGNRNQTVLGGLPGVFDVKLYVTGRVCKYMYMSIPEDKIIARANCVGEDYAEILNFRDRNASYVTDETHDIRSASRPYCSPSHSAK